MGFRRKRNDRLLMFCLRHYGPDQAARTRDAAQAESAAILDAFEGVALDPQAQAEIMAALTACADRQRAIPGRPDTGFVPVEDSGPYAGTLEDCDHWEDIDEKHRHDRRPNPDELGWELLGDRNRSPRSSAPSPRWSKTPSARKTSNAPASRSPPTAKPDASRPAPRISTRC